LSHQPLHRLDPVRSRFHGARKSRGAARLQSRHNSETGAEDAMIPMPSLTSDIYAQISETARRFAEDRIRPKAGELDESEAFPADLYLEMAGLGLFGITVPSDYGGAG